MGETTGETTTFPRRPAAEEVDRATFLYDDCCPLCRTYTATFSALGWVDRAPFSQVGDDTLDLLDMDRARHEIPLVDAATGQTKYGLDGILDVVTDHAPVLGAIGKQRHVRRGLDGVYYFITYNRRHIVASPPPATGIDCAPDYEPTAIKSYLTFSVAMVALLGQAAPAAIVATGIGAATLAARRDADWQIKPLVAAGHVGTVATAAAGAAALAGVAGASAGARTAVALVVGVRKLYLRRWMAQART